MNTITSLPREPFIKRKHVDGPVLIRSDSTHHWLTIRERIELFFGRIDAKILDERLSRRK